MNTKVSNSNLEFRKLKSLNYLYEVNSNGTIFRNVKSKKHLKIKLDFHHSKAGYYVTFVHLGGRGPNQRTVRVMLDKAVAECWLGDLPDGLEVDHIDRNSHNNDYRNLRYVTHSEQIKNRDHTNISKQGSINVALALEKRKIKIKLENDEEIVECDSMADAARYISEKYSVTFEHARRKFKQRRAHIYDYDVKYSECRD